MIQDDYVFISYSRRDRVFVEHLSLDLNDLGISTWVDTENIEPGTNWQLEISQSLKNASAYIVVISPNSINSNWMFSELSNIVRSKKPVLPVIIQDVDQEELPEFIRNIQWADFRESYSVGFESLTKGLKSFSRSDSSITTNKKKSKGYIFLSYAEEDADFTQQLKSFLQVRQYAYWDYEESDRDYNNQLFLELEGAISEASATISILSESWKHSKWAVKEFFFSEEVGIPVFLLKAKPISPTLAIAGMSFIDFTKDIENGYYKLNKELSRKRL